MADSRKKFFISIGISAFVVIALVAALKLVLFSRLDAEEDRYISNRQEIYSIEKKIEFKNELAAELKSIDADVIEIESILLKEKDKGSFIENLGTMAQASGVTYTINSAREVYEGRTDQLARIDFSLKLTGEFVNIMQFLDQLNSLPYFIDISSIRFDKLSEDSTGLDAGINFKVFAY